MASLILHRSTRSVGIGRAGGRQRTLVVLAAAAVALAGAIHLALSDE